MHIKKLMILPFFSISINLLSCSSRPKLENQKLNELATNHVKYTFANPEDRQLVAPGDLISLNYEADPRLNGSFRVAFDGILSLPYGFRESVIGLSITALESFIQKKYTHLFKNVSDITVKYLEHKRYIKLTGDLPTTGLFLIEPNADINVILSQLDNKKSATSFSNEDRKKLKYLRIRWQESALTLDLKKYFKNELIWENGYWRGGEVLSFLSNTTFDDNEFEMVRVMGDVNDPGSFELEKGKDFYSYILKAGGVNPTATLDHITLIRGDSFNREVHDANIQDLNLLGPPKPKDTLVVFQDRASKRERQIQMTAQIASILSAIAIIGMVL